MNEGHNGGRVCWTVTGTFCGGAVQGTNAQKIGNCIECPFFRQVRQEEGASFSAGAEALIRLTNRQGLEVSYLRLIDAFGELKRVSAELQNAQKLAAVGTLASGIAHEINTPTQFLGDSLHFLAESFREMEALLGQYRQALAAAPGLAAEPPGDAANLAYLLENVPAAFALALDGVSRIARIVGAMKDFAHPGGSEQSPEDLNRGLQAALAISQSEYKCVAEVETDLGELPPVVCHLGELNQVFLNLIVNAAHAITDVVGTGGTKGRIRVRTACEGDQVRVEIADTGGGISEEIRQRVFEPFFTTKEVGRGSGQGLAIARSIVVDKHGGSLTFESEVGKGTTFIIRLPVDGRAPRGEPPPA